MPYAPKQFRPFGQPAKRERQHASRQTEYRRWYTLAIWKRPGTGLRALTLENHPLCTECLKQNRITPSVIADHVVPHAGDWEKFIDLENLTGLCWPCHSRKTSRSQGLGGVS